MENCTACSDYKTCTTCETGFYINENKCQPCISPCTECLIDTGTYKCTNCIAQNYVDTNDDLCKACSYFIDFCELCGAVNVCENCEDNYYPGPAPA